MKSSGISFLLVFFLMNWYLVYTFISVSIFLFKVCIVVNAIFFWHLKLTTLIGSYLGQRGQVTQDTEKLETLIQKMNQKLMNSGKNDLISQSTELLQMFKQFHCKPMASFVTAPVPADFTRFVYRCCMEFCKHFWPVDVSNLLEFQKRYRKCSRI